MKSPALTNSLTGAASGTIHGGRRLTSMANTCIPACTVSFGPICRRKLFNFQITPSRSTLASRCHPMCPDKSSRATFCKGLKRKDSDNTLNLTAWHETSSIWTKYLSLRFDILTWSRTRILSISLIMLLWQRDIIHIRTYLNSRGFNFLRVKLRTVMSLRNSRSLRT